MAQPQIQLTDDVRQSLRSNDIVPRTITLRQREYYPKEHRAEGYKGVVWKGIDEYSADVAIKLVIYEDYMERSFLEEASRARSLSGRGCFADFIDAGLVEFEMLDGNKRKFVCFVEEWIDGWTLEEYLHQKEPTADFLVGYVKEMSKALNFLYDLQHRHDDLRPANVMIQRPRTGDLYPDELKVKVIDMGSLKDANAPLTKDKDDHLWFTEHLVDIRNAISRKKLRTVYESRFLNEVDPLIRHMLDEDRTVGLWVPTKVVALFENAQTRAWHPEYPEALKLQDPFDYIAAEHIASDKLLVSLFADSCPWFKEISNPNPVLLTGPRGCGKSMVFRRLSLKALLYESAEDIGESQIAGFYISCSADLRNRFGWIASESAAKRFKKEIIHYFNLLLTREIIQTLLLIKKRADCEMLFGFGSSQEKQVHSFILRKLGVTASSELRLHGVTRMQHALTLIESALDECYENMVRGVGTTHPTQDSFLTEFTRFLSNSIAYFAEKKIAFLIDDFSVHRLPKPVQVILNPVLWDRQAAHVFKLSAEKYGAVGTDELKAVAEITREFREVDTGQYYISLKRGVTRRFAAELLSNRLGLAGYKGSPDELIGRSQYEEGSLGKSLRARSSKTGRIDNQYHGLETIADLCSGDISNLLEIYRRIFLKGNVTKHSKAKIPSHVQHEAITEVSRELFTLIKNYVPQGPEMYNLVARFGSLSRRILREGYLQKKGRGFIPCETSRIEVDQPLGQAGEELTESQEELIAELVRRAVFIEMEIGRGRHKFQLTVRWQLRRVYCPAFGTSLTKNTAIKWRTEEFKRFIVDPDNMCDEEFNKRWKKGSRTAPEPPSLPFADKTGKPSNNMEDIEDIVDEEEKEGALEPLEGGG